MGGSERERLMGRPTQLGVREQVPEEGVGGACLKGMDREEMAGESQGGRVAAGDMSQTMGHRV